MVIAECKECGKEYEVKTFTNLSKYQCECGGELRTRSLKEINKQVNEELQQKKKNHMIIKGFRYGRKSTLTLNPNGLEIKTKGTLLGSGKETELVRYIDIIGVEKSKDLINGRKLIINTANDKKIVNMLEKDKYETFASILNQNISKAKESTGSVGGSENPYDEIRKAKELLDIEAITQEEFQKIKDKYLKMI